MSLQFVVGNSGSGKTEYVFKEVLAEASANPKKNYLIMAPEQSTIALQRKLVDLSEHKVIMNVDVLGFTRLAYRIFDELGMTALTVLEETGKNLVLRKVAQEKEDQLTVLRPNLNRMGYITEMKSLLSEFAQYHVTPQRLQALADKGTNSKVLDAKLRDICVMQQGFAEFMENKYITQEELLHVFCTVAERSEILHNCVIVFDDYTGFTPVQKEVLRVLLPMADRIQICLTMDQKEANNPSHGIQDLFHMPKDTMDMLYKMCKELEVSVDQPVILGDGDKKRYQKAQDLFLLEQNLFRPTYKRRLGETNQVQLYCAGSQREELIAAAREIHRLVKEEHYRYGEIAIVTGDVEAFEPYVDSVFRRYDLPYFLDVTTDIVFHPLIEFLQATLEVVEQGFSYQAVFRFLRTGYTPFEEQQIDELENYILAVGIRGQKAWSKRFARMPRQDQQVDLELIEQMRSEIYQWFEPLCQVFEGKEHKVRAQVKALYELIASLNVEQSIWDKQKSYEDKQMMSKAKEYEQIYGIVMGLFDKIVGVLGEEQMTIQEFTEILDAGLSAAKVATLPPAEDAVTIGDIQRTRLNAIKVLFFVGVNDGIIPKANNAGGIISEYERALMNLGEITLAPSARDMVFIQKYYLYLNLTKPQERVYISYATTDAEGKALLPSYLIGTIRKLFPDMKVSNFCDIEKLPTYATKEAAMDYLIHGKRDEEWKQLARYFSEHEEWASETKRLIDAGYYVYEEEPISRAVAQAIYGKKMKGSVTRLEQFSSCAYAYFLQYGLLLRERETSGFAAIDMGNIYHDALQRYSEKLEASEWDWFKIPDEEREKLTELAMEEAIAEYPALTTYGTGESSFQVQRMKRILGQTVWALTEQVRRGSFVPSGFELAFYQADDSKTLRFELSEKEEIELTGRVDRLDLAEDPSHVYVKIIDYKSGSTEFDLVKIYQGLQLQLVTYMNAMEEAVGKKHPGKDVIPGGMFYYRIDEPLLDGSKELSEEEYKVKLLEALCPDGPVNEQEEIYRLMDADFEDKSQVIPVKLKKDGTLAQYSKALSTEQFQVMEEYVSQYIKDCAERIYSGKVSVSPYKEGERSSCSFCPFLSVCGFDVRVKGFDYRVLPKPDKDEILERMEVETAKMKAQRDRKE